MKNWLLKYRLHIFIWIAFMFHETVLTAVIYGRFGIPAAYIIHYTVIICLFYLQAHQLMPWLVKSKNKFLMFLASLGFLALYVALHAMADVLLTWLGLIPAQENYGVNQDFILRNIYRGIFFIGFASGYYFLRTYIQERKKTADLEQQRLEGIINQQRTEQELVSAQNAFLKAQINPHFLFNALDFVYHSVNEKSPQAGEAIVRLSDMMRHAINAEKMSDLILLADEIEQAENLMYLYQIRKSEPLNLQLHYQQQVLEVKFIPLVLLTLVENIFKHGDLTDPKERALINIGISHDYFFIETTNRISQMKSLVSNKAGLQNVEKRLLTAYGNDIQFDYGSSPDGLFKVSIIIPVDRL